MTAPLPETIAELRELERELWETANVANMLQNDNVDREKNIAKRDRAWARHKALKSFLTAAARGVESEAARDVLAERRRQVEAEGWTLEHDDAHANGELAAAAACYASFAASDDRTRRTYERAPESPMKAWPWSGAWWKPKDRRSDLVRAGALILAEIERLDRAGPPARS